MTISRALTLENETGESALINLNDTVNWLSGMDLGRLTNVAGTNTITAELAVDTGFTALSNNAKCQLVPAANNTGAVTLNIEGSGAIAVRNADGDALSADDLVADRLYDLVYNSTENYWRVLGINSDAATPTSVIFTKVKSFISGSGTWVTPVTGWYRFWVIGGGGSGGRGGTTDECTGGGGAGVAIKIVYLNSGVTLTYSVGAGGAAATTNGNGNAGGATEISGTGLGTLTANGGGAGQRSTSGSATGAPGGTASGGDINITGQTSPNAGNNVETCGGIISLIETPSQPAADTTTAQNFWTGQATPVSVIGPFSTGTSFTSGDGGTSPTAGANGCGGGGSEATNSGAGGGGLIVIEYEV